MSSPAAFEAHMREMLAAPHMQNRVGGDLDVMARTSGGRGLRIGAIWYVEHNKLWGDMALSKVAGNIPLILPILRVPATYHPGESSITAQVPTSREWADLRVPNMLGQLEYTSDTGEQFRVYHPNKVDADSRALALGSTVLLEATLRPSFGQLPLVPFGSLAP